jgi:hypothetical protein
MDRSGKDWCRRVQPLDASHAFCKGASIQGEGVPWVRALVNQQPRTTALPQKDQIRRNCSDWKTIALTVLEDTGTANGVWQQAHETISPLVLDSEQEFTYENSWYLVDTNGSDSFQLQSCRSSNTRFFVRLILWSNSRARSLVRSVRFIADRKNSSEIQKLRTCPTAVAR